KFIEAVELERIRRVRDGSYKRERSQQLVTKAPDVLSGLLLNEKNSPKHRIDAVKVLDDLAEGGPRAVHNDTERVIIRIDMGADVRAKGLESNPDDVLVYDVAARPSPADADEKVIDAASQQIPYQEEVVTPRRGPGRPPGSKNKPKTTNPDDDTPSLPGFAV